ncbi:MAG: hypothetical protein ACJ8FI_06405 [Sphingomicrobium sp.]
MSRAAILFFITFAFSTLFARNAPWQWAFYHSLFGLKQIEPEAVQRQVRGRTLNQLWAWITIFGSGLVGSAVFFPDPVMLVPLLAGVILIVTFAFAHGFKLFKTGLSELGIELPAADQT